MKRVSHLSLIIATICAFAACSGTGSLSTNPADIQGDWELASIDGTELQTSEDDGAYTISFNADNTIAGLADCNYFTGKYTAPAGDEEGRLNLESVSATKVECGKQSQYDVFVRSVRNAQSFQVEGGNQLVLSSGDAKKIVFNRTEAEEEG